MALNPLCECHRCLEERNEQVVAGEGFSFPVSATRMILCPLCGNKRCPHANDHRHPCTHSNAPGQPGSAYP
jgi:hypothetical protein